MITSVLVGILLLTVAGYAYSYKINGANSVITEEFKEMATEELKVVAPQVETALEAVEAAVPENPTPEGTNAPQK